MKFTTMVQSDPDLPGPDLPEPRFTGSTKFSRYRKLTVFDPDIPGTPIYRAKPFPPSIPVNRGPTVSVKLCNACLCRQMPFQFPIIKELEKLLKNILVKEKFHPKVSKNLSGQCSDHSSRANALTGKNYKFTTYSLIAMIVNNWHLDS
eukprot:sb/3473724/